MNIRYANTKDIELIARNNQLMALETESRELPDDIIFSGVEAVLDDPALGFYLILEKDGTPAGQLLVTTEWSDWRNGMFWWIQSVYVTPHFRKQGVYRTLHEETKKLARETGNVVGIRLYVDYDNENAQAVYRKMGMKESNYIFFEEDWS